MENSKLKYKTIDLPIEVFENALIDGDLSEVEDFESIFDEYCQCVGGEEYKAQIDSLKEVTLLKSKIMLAQNIMAMITTVPTDELFEMLKELNYHIAVPAPTLDDIHKYCTQIEPIVRLDAVKLAILEKNMEPKKKKKQKEIIYTRDYFTDNILDINEVMHYNISKKDSMRTYCRAVVKCQQRINKMNQQKKKQHDKIIILYFWIHFILPYVCNCLANNIIQRTDQ